MRSQGAKRSVTVCMRVTVEARDFLFAESKRMTEESGYRVSATDVVHYLIELRRRERDL